MSSAAAGVPSRWQIWAPFLATIIASLLGVAGITTTQFFQYSQFNTKLEEDHKQFNTKLEEDRKNAEALRKQELGQRVKDFQLTFFQRQITVYTEMCEVVTRIAMARTIADAEKDIDKLQEIIVGKLAVIADERVMSAVFGFNDKLRDLKRDASVPEDLQLAAYNVSQECGASLRDAFDLRKYAGTGTEFKPLKKRRE